MNIRKATAADFLCLFAGQAGVLANDPLRRFAWRERAEDLAAFLAAHEESISNASFITLLQVGGLLMLEAERLEKETQS
ncbi:MULTISPECIES: hypothetical protein [unclassified Sphingomonas]|uniref:hypothetical protein n=1 Tax=unclassified Sphingomonas TaxID=196159 RepID=UPI00226AF886|nr:MULTISPECIES: hypothetical protein [unclassified Sphingomonas]